MEKVYVMDNRGHETEGFKIRYFSYGEANYFIYTLGEIDADEYVKLYIKKLKNGEEQFISEEEWFSIKEIIQKIVKEIRSGNIVSFKDLNMTNLNEIMETDTRVFKLKKSIVEEIIYEEPKVEIQEPVEEPKREPIKPEKNPDDFIENLEDSIKNTFSDDLYRAPKEETKIKPIVIGSLPNNELKEKNESLQKELEDYKVITYKLKEENTILKKKLIEYREKLETIKTLTRDI
jgi:FtsZ-binding cell division protein ZapB